MKILITNDDGIESPGIHILAETLAMEHEVTVVAPEKEASGFSHAVSIFKNIFVTRHEIGGNYDAYYINGMPVDCVKFGLREVLKDNPPDAVISGINNMPNLGSDCIFSGTVNAAIDGAMCGVKSIALSLLCNTDDEYCYVSEFTLKNLSYLLSLITTDTMLNINFPSGNPKDIKGVRFTEVGKKVYNDFYVEQEADGKMCYRLFGYPIPMDNSEYSDIVSDDKGYITVSPIKVCFTDYKVLESIKDNADKIIL